MLQNYHSYEALRIENADVLHVHDTFIATPLICITCDLTPEGRVTDLW